MRLLRYFLLIALAVGIVVYCLRPAPRRRDVDAELQRGIQIEELGQRLEAIGVTLLHSHGVCELLAANSKITDGHLRAVEGVHELERVDLMDTSITGSGLRYLRKLPNLKRLWLNDTQVSDEACEYIGGCRALREVILSGSAVKGPGLRWLAGCKKLEFLDLNECALVPSALSGLAQCPALRILSLRQTGLNDEALQYVAQIRSLEQLYVGRNAIDGSGLGCLRHLDRLKSLSLFENPLREQDLRGLSELTCGELSVGGVSFDESLLVRLAEIRSLADLTVSAPRIVGASMREVAKRAKLRKLDIGTEVLSIEAMQGIGQMVGLESLSIVGPITDDGVARLGKLRHLTFLSLRDEKITDKCLGIIKEMTALTDLDLSKCDIGNDVMDVIASLPDLQYVTLCKTRVDDRGMARLVSRRGKLARCDVTDTAVTKQGKELAERANPGLNVLSND